jgi:hypothetical protein
VEQSEGFMTIELHGLLLLTVSTWTLVEPPPRGFLGGILEIIARDDVL